ncbi:heme exporter protein B [Anoxybacillus tengchongensis]|uniref:Heme exporter protein B n=1 Tax=Anoxybacillus tengchongensis TaxID=576944 RepID=A0A7W9YNE6_9BACL|nr:heme exporter protein CcmB [Anoxybacillus tengchongensis]MBB6175407.1 heme exporter protein B [Anoxybacillus tengchongensis]
MNIKQIWMITKKELYYEYKEKQNVMFILVFALLMITTYSFSFTITQDLLKQITPGFIWIVTIFTGVMCFERSISYELHNDCLTGLLVAPIEKSAIYIGKAIANFLILFCTNVIVIPLLFILFDFRYYQHLSLFFVVMVVGLFGFSIVGTFLACISNKVLFYILLLPMVSPLLIAGAQSTKILFLTENQIHDMFSWLKMMIAYDCIFFTVCYWLIDFVLGE